MESADPAIAMIHETRGMATEIAKLLGISREAVSQWQRVPPAHALVVAKHLKRHPHFVRPDVYPPPRSTKRSARSPTHVKS